MTDDEIMKGLAEKAREVLAEQDRVAAKSITDHFTPKKTYSGYEWVDSRGAQLPASKIEVLLYEILQELRRVNYKPDKTRWGAP